MMFRDQPDYARDLQEPNLGQIARLVVDRYLNGDPPTSERDYEHEERDPASWRRYTIRRTRWRIERELEADRARMMEEAHADQLYEAYGWRPFAPPPTVTWMGEGGAPWDEDDDNN